MREVMKNILRGGRYVFASTICERAGNHPEVQRIIQCPNECNGSERRHGACYPCAKEWCNTILKILPDKTFVVGNLEKNPDVFVIIPPPYIHGGTQIQLKPRKK